MKNVAVIGLGRFGSKIAVTLSQKGFDVIEIELSEFIKAGGSAKCLTLKLIDSVIPFIK